MGDFVFSNFKKNHVPLLELFFGNLGEFGVDIGGAPAVGPSVNRPLDFANQTTAVDALGGTAGVAVRVFGPFGKHSVQFRSLNPVDFDGDLAHESS
jgi:hypothetical protein